MADALASGASVLYGRGGSSPPSPTAKILGSVKASEDFLFLVAVGVGLGLKQRQVVELRLLACPLTLLRPCPALMARFRGLVDVFLSLIDGFS